MLAIEGYADLGVHDLRMHIEYPFLCKDFPFQLKYIDFYQDLATLARSKGFTIFVKSAIMPNNPGYGIVDSTVYNFIVGKNRKRYMAEKLQMLQAIIDSIKPDYLAMEGEPGTMGKGSGFNFDFSPDSMQFMLNCYLDHLQPNGVRDKFMGRNGLLCQVFLITGTGFYRCSYISGVSGALQK